MAESMGNVFEKIKADAKKYATAYCRGAAKEAERLLNIEANRALDRFYSDYHPTEYRRTYNLRNHSFTPYYSNSHNRAFTGGVVFDSANMFDYYDDHNPPRLLDGRRDIVFTSALYGGSHGGAWITSPAPMVSIERFFNLSYFMDAVDAKGLSAAEAAI